MPWIAGIDEAGYGPNLGPFVMTAVVCRVRTIPPEGCLWSLLSAAVRRGGKAGKGDKRLVIDDSKVVHNGKRGLANLERGVFATLGKQITAPTLAQLLTHLSGATELGEEVWYTGTTTLPAATDDDLPRLQATFADACAPTGVDG